MILAFGFAREEIQSCKIKYDNKIFVKYDKCTSFSRSFTCIFQEAIVTNVYFSHAPHGNQLRLTGSECLNKVFLSFYLSATYPGTERSSVMN